LKSKVLIRYARLTGAVIGDIISISIHVQLNLLETSKCLKPVDKLKQDRFASQSKIESKPKLVGSPSVSKTTIKIHDKLVGREGDDGVRGNSEKVSC
jgi:hypothetical protein